MTALIYKAALPTYTSLEDLVANADENLVLNDAGTAYELEPAQSGASVYAPGTDRLSVETDYNATQTIVAGAQPVRTTLTYNTPAVDRGDSFVVGTKGIQIVAGTLFAGKVFLDVADAPSVDVVLAVRFAALAAEANAQSTSNLPSSPSWYVPVKSGDYPYIVLPFTLIDFPLGRWLVPFVWVLGSNLGLDDFGGMDIFRIA